MIKNIIFDLGGVIINIDYEKTTEAFKKLGAKDFASAFTYRKQIPLFDAYDIGAIDCNTFQTELHALLQLDSSISLLDIENAWNAMVLDLPLERLEFIKNLRKQGYKTFLFSNTNKAHLRYVAKKWNFPAEIPYFSDFFDKEYYSCHFGIRKPDTAGFQKILEENKLDPTETVFVDDLEHNLAGAEMAGIHTLLITPQEDIFSIKSRI